METVAQPEQDFDKEISTRTEIVVKLQQELLDLRFRRNASVPFVARLSAEILVEIFCQIVHSHSQLLLRSYRNPFKWTVVSHVCRWWRSVALDLPWLW